MDSTNTSKICIIGLGYVGLPLAVAFAKKYSVVGFDINEHRITRLNQGEDDTLEISSAQLEEVLESKENLKKGHGLFCTSQLENIDDCNFYIVTVPTPIDQHNKPDLTPLVRASETVGKSLKKNDIVVFESTVYPGATEEVCVPILEKESGLSFNVDFQVGYSPERINPGDKEHTVEKILKVTSGSNEESAQKIDTIYQSVITAGTYLAASIKVAEAAKVIENSQRDINIAFVNELAIIFNKMGIDTEAVLAAAGTKWNFLPFRPGLVGGHCIGVDPYYLAQKAEEVGYHPEIILAGRRLNDKMGSYVANQVIKLMVHNDLTIKGSRVLILGITFKENCPDIRNTKVVDIIWELQSFGVEVDIYDPWASSDELEKEYGLTCKSQMNEEEINHPVIIQAVSHKEFKENIDFSGLKEKNVLIYDVKSIIPPSVAYRL